MSAAITLIGLNAGFPNPGNYVQINFAMGPSGASGGGNRPVLIMGNATTAGSATANTVVYGPDTSVPCQTETDVINLFGAGSQLHRAFLRFTAVNQTTPLYFLVVAPSAGAAATGTLTFSATATATANCRVWVEDMFADFTISTGDTPTTQATNCAAAINAKYQWPCSATSSVGVVTLTHRNLGPEGNFLAYGAVITSSGTGAIGTTVTPVLPTLMTGGTTADSNTTALGTIKSTRYYNILVCDSDATNVGAVVSQVNTLALPLNGIRQRVFAGFTGTLANCITLATGLNAPRCELALTTGTDLPPLEAAANNCAIFTLLENRAYPRHNFSLFPSLPSDQTQWFLTASRTGPGAGLTQAQITSALNNGITPYAIVGTGKLQLVKRITSYSLNGSVQDTRCRDACKVYESDNYGDDLSTLLSQQFSGKDLINDPPAGGPTPQGNLVWPRLIADAVNGLTQVYVNNGRFQNGPAIIAGTIVQRDPFNKNRVDILVPVQVVDILDQVASLINQVG